ncbi:MAG: hypothetical protein IOD12_10990 [Silvanigrellales bacterium]|nr:hypothetical protein [Silvanigrellales bacterium]
MKPSKAIKISNFELGFAKSKNIKHEVFKVIVQETDYPTRNYTVQVKFGTLSEPNYSLLMDHYGGQKIVPFSATREYELVDFLPPKIQALVNRWFFTTMEELPNMPPDWKGLGLQQETAVSTAMNCWHTAYEVIRDFGKPWKEMTGRLGGFGLLEASTLLGESTKIPRDVFALERSQWEKEVISASLKTNDASALLAGTKRATRNANRAVGDMLEVKTAFAPIAPAHVALWIDDDLYFEKTNIGFDDPIRLAFYEDVVEPYFGQDEEGRPMTLSFVRWSSDKSLFPAQESFAGKDPVEMDRSSRGQAPLSKLPPDIAKSVISSLDAGTGGGPVIWAPYRILSFPLVQNPTTGRVEMDGADKLLKFQASPELCKISSRYKNPFTKFPSPFSYTIDSNLLLTISNKTSWKTVATLKGKYSTRPVPTRSGRNDTAYVDFPAGGKVLSLVVANPSSSSGISYAPSPGRCRGNFHRLRASTGDFRQPRLSRIFGSRLGKSLLENSVFIH